MIKKIGSNKYGVVEYAISSVEDIADLPLGVAIGSTAVLINKDGIRTFALGEGEWVEYIDAERYDKNKLAQDLLFCGFGNDGEKHDDLDDRLMVEFDEINERVNVGNYLEYNGCNVKADYSLEGLQRGVMLEGRTLQNVGTTRNNGMIRKLHATVVVSTLLKPSTTYTMIIRNKANEDVYFYWSNHTFPWKAITVKANGILVDKSTALSEIKGENCLSLNQDLTLPQDLDIVLLEGDHTQTPLEELPFIEGIESVGESELTDDGCKISGKSCGKNLIKSIMPKTQSINGVDITVNDDGSVTFNGTATKQTTINVDTNPTSSSDVKKIKSGTYSLSDVNGNYNVLFTQLIIRDSRGNQTSYNILNEGVSNNNIRINANSWEKLLFIIRANQPLNNVTLYPQLEESSIATPYEPYKESTYSYILDEPLRSLPNGVCDTIDLETGVLTRRVGKVVLDGSESWRKGVESNENFNDFRVGMNGLINKNKEIGICDRFIYGSKNAHWIAKEEAIMLYAHTAISEIIVSIPVSKINNLETFKQWLQANPTTIYYELVEPTIHQLDQNRIYSFKDTTHIISDNLIAPRITTNVLTNSNALISHLKGENLALANEVSTLSLRNRETQETNETQDHIIDASLCAVDELYMMYETTQEVEVMSADEEGSRMVDMYVAMVQRGLKTIDQVPVRYREKVREILAQLED